MLGPRKEDPGLSGPTYSVNFLLGMHLSESSISKRLYIVFLTIIFCLGLLWTAIAHGNYYYCHNFILSREFIGLSPAQWQCKCSITIMHNCIHAHI